MAVLPEVRFNRQAMCFEIVHPDTGQILQYPTDFLGWAKFYRRARELAHLVMHEQVMKVSIEASAAAEATEEERPAP